MQLKIQLKAKDMHHMLYTVLPICKLLKQPQCTKHAQWQHKRHWNKSIKHTWKQNQITMQEHLYFIPSNEPLFPIIILPLGETTQNQSHIFILVITIHCILLICNLTALLFCTIAKALQRNCISPKQAPALNKEHHTLANWPGKQGSEREK